MWLQPVHEHVARHVPDVQEGQPSVGDLTPDDISIAFDAWLGERGGFDFEALVEHALLTYEQRFPGGASARFVTERCGGKDFKNHKMDVYCTFCRGLLVARISTMASPTSFARVMKHTTGCALACLAGRREMKAPGTRGLIDEDLTL